MKKKTKKSIDYKALAAQAIVDLIVGIILILPPPPPPPPPRFGGSPPLKKNIT